MRIAFLSLNAYDMLTGGHEGNVGGAQLQQILIAKELAERGHDVYFVENEAEYKEETVADGIRVVLKNDHPEGFLPARLAGRVRSTLEALRTVDPDVVYARVPTFDLFPVSVYCTLTETRFVYNFAHDSEVTDDPVILDSTLTDNRIYWGMMQKALSTADVLVAQNDFQYDRARQRYPDTNVELVWNGYPDPGSDHDARGGPLDDDRPQVLWVATLREWKQPEVVLELADRVPEVEFVVVGGRATEAPGVYDRVERAASETDNVRFEGFVPYEKVDEYFAAADAFVNTSTDEGFPNTFLQSWAHRMPVVSLNVDPNGILNSNEIGHCAGGSVDEMADALGELVRDEERRRRYGRNAYEYFRGNHSIQRVVDRYEAAFRSQVSSTVE